MEIDKENKDAFLRLENLYEKCSRKDEIAYLYKCYKPKKYLENIDKYVVEIKK